MKYILIFCMLLFGHKSYTQNFFTSFYAGSSNYQGDLSEKIYETKHTHFAWGLGFLYELNEHFLLRADFSNGRISGSDADGTKNRSRNLSFTSSITEFSLGVEYTLLNLYNYKVSPYFFAGIGIFKFSPYAEGTNGTLVGLWELNTEGQGFYEDRKPYKLSQFVLPFGGGVQWAISDNARIGFVIGLRQTFTDYLDDVSTTYVDRDLLMAKRGGNSVALAYRGDELPDGQPYPPDGTPRGNPKNRDWYYFSGLTFRIRLPNIKSHRKHTYKVPKSRVTCPKPVL